MKNILLALVCLLTFSFKNYGDDKPKCCTDKCSKECIAMCKKNKCTDMDCCKKCETDGCKGGACCKKQTAANASCKAEKSSCCKKATASTEAKTAAVAEPSTKK